MNDVSPQVKRRFSPLIAAGALLIIALVGYVGYTQYQEQRFVNLMELANASYRAGEFTQAIEYSSDAAAIASQGRDVLAANTLLGRSLINRAGAEDLQHGVAILKDVIATPRADAMYKSLAYAKLAALYRIGENNDNLKQMLFDSPPFDAYLVQAKGDVRDAVLSVAQEADSFWPTPYSKFWVALLLTEKLNERGVEVENLDHLEVATTIRDLISAGDVLLASADITRMSSSELMNLYRSRSYALGAISFYFPEVETSTIEESYDRTLSLMDTVGSGGTFTQEQRLMFLLNYSAVLSARISSAQNDMLNGKVQTLLSTFVRGAKESTGIAQNVMERQARPANNYMKKQLPALAKISPEFAEYLKQIAQ